MNCLQCSAPLEDQARFCRNCGNPVAIGSPTMPSANDSPTVPTPASTPVPQPQYAQQAQWQSPPTLPASPQWNQMPPVQPASSQPQYAPQSQWMPPAQPVAPQPGSMQSVGTLPRSRKRKWLLRLLIILIVLIVLLTGGWFLAGRPLLHSVAQNQFDQLLAGQINTILPLPTAITSLAVTENQMNNLITLNHAPSDPVQNVVAHIAPALIASDGSYTGGVELDFQLFGFGCSIRGIPAVSNGQIVMTHVQVSGILSLVMSSDEMTTLLNSHLHDAFARMHRQATGLTLKNQEIDIQLSSNFVATQAAA
ncbi:MAG TPA: zinc ribbon domain-containing protein [Ktedonobacteraceae bacterium]|nr:zinc ribbon domain-containing protein [Ktedonobacteraceae bacterium]